MFPTNWLWTELTITFAPSLAEIKSGFFANAQAFVTEFGLPISILEFCPKNVITYTVNLFFWVYGSYIYIPN